MASNSDIRLVRSLREKKFREESGLFVVEGEKMVREAQESGFELTRIFSREEDGEEAMKKMSSLSTAPPVLAVVKKPEHCLPDISDISVISDGLFLALDSVRDPGNLGTILRTADWFGVSTVFASEDSVELYNPKVIQSSMGSVFRIALIVADIVGICRRFRQKGLPVWGTFLDGNDIYSETLECRGLLVMGNESNGISPAVASEVDRRLRIPSFKGSGAESLNVAVATAVTLSEFRRR